MKLITRSAFALVFLIGLATPLLAQGPNVSVQISPAGSTSCFLVTVRNLRTTMVTFTTADMAIFDPKCKQVCGSKMALKKKLDPCQTLSFRICCQKPLPVGYICYVRVNHNFGSNEEWLF
jgi:hypothetical protein